jgi:hypothetical protein
MPEAGVPDLLLGSPPECPCFKYGPCAATGINCAYYRIDWYYFGQPDVCHCQAAPAASYDGGPVEDAEAGPAVMWCP